MNRRSLLKHLASLPLVFAIEPYISFAEATSVPASRVRPGEPAWPGAASWEKLKQQVGGNLIPIDFPLNVCTSTSTAPACQILWKDLDNPFFIGDTPGLTQTMGWANAWATKPSVYAVAAQNAEHIVAAVNFARANRLRLVIKGGGHSYQGTSNAADSLLIWTRHMDEIRLHDAFLPRSCPNAKPQPAVTLGAGVIWLHAYDAVTTKAGKYVQGGGCTTVGVAGLIQSGGFGSFSKHYGTAASALLEAEVVTADGEIRIVNSCTNPDLFWALKGGGGGSFGAVSKITLRLHELPEFAGGAFFTVKASSDAAFRRLLQQFIGFYKTSLFNDHWGEQAHVNSANSLEISMVSHGLTTEQGKQIWQPFLDWIARLPDDYSLATPPPIIGSMPARFWWDPAWRKQHNIGGFVADPRPNAHPYDVWWDGDGGQVGWFIYAFESLWLPASLLNESAQARLVDALFAASRHRGVELHFNKGLAGAPAEAIAAARDTATNPAVLDAFALAIIASGQDHAYPGLPGHEPDLAAARKKSDAVAKSMDELRKLAPNGGAYVSESNYFEPSFGQAYWGSNYARLRDVKKKYDPDGLFFVHNGVGSEDWSPDGFTRLR
jgi:FAD/FMN-containing dehydrogenase